MEFWQVYFCECLQKPWMVNPIPAPLQLSEPQTTKVFLFPKGLSDEGLEMLKRMVQALKYSADEVTLLAVNAENVETLRQWQNSKKILCFGEEYPGQYGDFIHWNGHKIMKTNSVESLLQQASLKKSTWDHLKVYASLP